MLPSIFGRAAAAVATRFGYHVIDSSRNRRKVSAANLKTEDDTLKKRGRERLIETARDADRNFALAAWAIGKHLDFVTTHSFHCKNPDRGLRRDVEAYIADRQRRQNFDASGRFSMDAWMRLIEARAVMDGDVFGVRLSGGTMQAMEGIYCRDPGRPVDAYPDRKRWTQGVYLGPAERPLAYSFGGRVPGDDQIVPAGRIVHHGYFRRFHQARGVGLIVPGLATLVDTYELFDYSIAKAKVAQLFALAIYREGDKAPAPISTVSAGSGDAAEAATTGGNKYEIDFGKGPAFLDLDPGERAEFLSTQTPGIDPAFLESLINISLKALDLPLCWFDESKATFSGNRAAVILYVQSCKPKRKAIVEIRSDWTDWQLDRAFANGDLLRPSAEIEYTWTAAGVPFWNPQQEVNAQLDAIDGVLTTRARVVEETLGCDWQDLVEEAAAEEALLRERGLLKDRSGKPIVYSSAA